MTADDRRRRAVRDFGTVVGRVDRERRGPTPPALPAARTLVKDLCLREQVDNTIEAASVGEPWWRTYTSPYAIA